SGSSKSHESSVSSESSTAYPPHPNAPIAECQSHTSASPSQGGSQKRQGKKKKSDRKLSVGEKAEARLSAEGAKDSSKSGTLPLSMDQSGNSGGNTSLTIQNGAQQQLNQSQMSPGSKASSTHDSKALQMAALTHALSCMKKFHKPLTDSGINEEADEGEATPGKKWQEYFSNDIQVDDNSDEDTFASVVSLEDGIIVYITPSIANILGFPKDMLVGRSFIDFVHPKDRMAFASHITCGMSFPMSEQHSPQNQGSNIATGAAARVKSEPFYCRLRQYRGLKTVGFGVVDKTVLYYPFKLTMTLKKVENGNNGAAMPTGAAKSNPEASRQNSGKDGDTQNAGVHLAIVAKRIKSAYQYPEEIPINPGKFVTRHSASCHFGHMDSDAISYLGHLPQDLIGNSVLDYYHPEDMGLMKEIYEGVMQEQGKPFRSKPYRFRAYNGTFAMLETDWSCFINPWSWKLEFVIGQHRVLKGPGNPNVFMQPNEETDYIKNAPGKIMDESKEMQSDIKRLLTEVRKSASKTATRRLSDPLRQQSSRRRKDLAALMESLLEGMAKTENSDKSGSQCSGMFSVMERDSVMLGEISPHHDDQSGSNQSSETPPSYNQLNYRENIESHPKTVRSDESAESKMDTNQTANRSSGSDGSKSSPNIDYSSGSNVRLSNSSGSGSGSNENESSNDRDLCASPLTEERLSRHNEAMEKYMIQRHRELRGKSSMTPGSHKDGRHKHSEKVYYTPIPVASSASLSNDNDKCSYYIKLLRCQRQKESISSIKGEASHGVKRMGNASWDGDMHTAKQPHLECLPSRNPTLNPAAAPGVCCPGHNTINLWPPFSITMTPGITTSTYRN
ncbi:Period circadian protein, partial [Orchesella cincta]